MGRNQETVLTQLWKIKPLVLPSWWLQRAFCDKKKKIRLTFHTRCLTCLQEREYFFFIYHNIIPFVLLLSWFLFCFVFPSLPVWTLVVPSIMMFLCLFTVFSCLQNFLLELYKSVCLFCWTSTCEVVWMFRFPLFLVFEKMAKSREENCLVFLCVLTQKEILFFSVYNLSYA